MLKPMQCPKCPSNQFSETVRPMQAAGRDMIFVHCTMCGTVIAVIEQAGVIALLQKIAKAVNIR